MHVRFFLLSIHPAPPCYPAIVKAWGAREEASYERKKVLVESIIQSCVSEVLAMYHKFRQ
jgi:hypothetical protein